MSCQYASTGRSGLGLLRDDEGRAAQRRALASQGLDHEYRQSRPPGRGPIHVGPGQNDYLATPSGLQPVQSSWEFPTCPYCVRPPGKVIRHLTRQATLSFGGSRPARLSSGSVRRRTRKWTKAGGPCGMTGRDLILQRKHAKVPSEDLGSCAGPTLGAFECATC